MTFEAKIKGKRLIGHSYLLDYYEDTKGNTYAYDGKKVRKITDEKDKYQAKLYSIGQSKGLDGTELHTFCSFMQKRFPNEKDEAYIEEWAERFTNGIEWQMSDSESQKALKEVNFAKYHNYK